MYVSETDKREIAISFGLMLWVPQDRERIPGLERKAMSNRVEKLLEELLFEVKELNLGQKEKKAYFIAKERERERKKAYLQDMEKRKDLRPVSRADNPWEL